MNLESKRLNKLRMRMEKNAVRKRKWIILPGTLLILLLASYLIFFPGPPLPSTNPTEDIHTPSEGTQPRESQHQIIEGRVKERSTFFNSLMEKNVPLHWIEMIISKLKPHVNFRKIKGGTYRLFMDVKGKLVKFIFEASPTEIYEIEKDSQGYTVQMQEVVLETYCTKVVGEIRSSLFEAMDAAGEQDQLVVAFAEALAWEIDFYKDVREGDRFKVVVGKVYKGDQFIQYGPIFALEYRGAEKKVLGIRYQGEYYNEDGVSLRKAFLKTPLRFNRISSRFSQARRHPILGGLRPHYGVDYAAPIGTPIWAVADGTVYSVGWNTGFGKQIILRHTNGYMTYYGHLSSYGSGIRKGVRVSQKQIVGYVGSTGLSTGPHLDYRLAKEGRFRNPLKENFTKGTSVPRREMGNFQMEKNKMTAWLQGDNSYSKRVDEIEKITQDVLGR